MGLRFLNSGYFAGSVGIGTETPDSLLHIYNSSTSWDEEAVITLGTDIEGTTQAQLRYYRGLTDATTEAFQIIIGSTTALTALGTSGNVGIGTETPVSTWLTGFDPSTGNGTFKLTSEGWIVTPFLTGLAGYYPGQGARPIIWADGTGTNIQSWDSDATDGVTIRSSDGARRLFVKENGNVGIGNVSPESLLHIKGADPILLIQDDSTGTAQASSTLRLGESGAAGVLDIYWDIKQAADDLNTHLEINHSSNGNAFAITDNRNVGIGTLVPRVQTEVQGLAQQVANISDTGNSGGTLQVSDTSNAANAGGAILFAAKNDNDTYTPQASIKSLLQNGGGQGIGDLAFSTRNAAADTTLTERMRITSDGIIKVATRQALKPSTFGYNSSYKTLVIGSTSANYQTEAVTLAFNVDVGANTDGSFTGDGSELLFRNIAKFITPNANNTGYVKPLTLNNGRVGIGTQAPNALLEVDSITYSANNAIANFVNGNNPVRVAYDTVVIAQTDVPCLSIVETIDGSQANEQKLSFSVGDNKAIIRSSATAVSGLYINVAGTNTAPGYNTADGLNAIRVLNNGDSIFNYKVGIGTTNPILKLHIEGTNSLPATSGIAQNGGIRIENGVNNGVLDIGASNATGAPGWLQSTDKTDLSQSYKLLLNPNGGDVGIGTTTPQSKLQVAGGIQMADDTATASATKVGTMRYRTGTEYVEVTGTELVTGTDSNMSGPNNWTNNIGSLVFDINTTVANRMWCNFTTGNQHVILPNTFTASKVYRVSLTARLNSGTATIIQIGTFTSQQSDPGVFNITPTSTTETYTGYITVNTDTALSIGIINANNNGSDYEFGDVLAVEVTSEDASYADMCMQTGASTYEWVNIVRNTY